MIQSSQCFQQSISSPKPIVAQERADCRGAENPDGEVEDVNFWTSSQFLSNRNLGHQDLLRKTRATLSMYSDVLDELIATPMHNKVIVEDIHCTVDDRHDGQ